MIKTIDNKVTPFGGIHLVHSRVLANKIPQFIDQVFGERSSNAVYGYSDLFLSMSYTTLCGGDCAEDIEYLRETFEPLKGMKTPSPDRILGMQKELGTQAIVLTSEKGAINKLNINDKLNDILVKTSLFLGVLDRQEKDYCLDFDHQFIPTEKYDATYSYKHQKGYFPAVASIDNIPVYIENRNGNCSVKYNQLDTLQRVFKVLEENELIAKRSRMDCGSYLKEVSDWLHEKGTVFYIRAEQSEQLLFTASLSEDWKECTIGTQVYETCSIDYEFGKYIHRVVCYRRPNKTGQVSAITCDANNYLFIITNDREWEEKTIIEFYNNRGNSERLFDIQNNDFNWKNLPFSFLEENTVYLILMAMCHVLYRWLINFFSKICSFIKPHYRLKKFIFRVICIAAKVTKTGRRQVVKLFTPYNFPSIINTS